MKDAPAQKQPAVFIETYGCQMNKYDSELVAGLLESGGCSMTADLETADVILVNTCSVREHAEKRVFGRLSVLAHWKKQLPGKRLGLIGCMARRLGSELLDECPELDFILGPDNYRQLPGLITGGRTSPLVDIAFDKNEHYSRIDARRAPGVCGWVAVMRGCDNYCSYCIVPYTRGRERSRPADDIILEIERMGRSGYREVTLLGQNVNSYHDGKTGFPALLRMTGQISSVHRIRFMTSHPKDLSPRLLDVMAEGQRIMPHIHLPVQAGSDRILSLMNRNYTRQAYMDMVDQARDVIPGLSVTTDIMVGFPGETEKDFSDTVNLMERIRFDEAFTYHYSVREGTRAASMRDMLSEEEKLRRLDIIIRLQREITLEKKQAMIGRVVEVLPESTSRKAGDEWLGRTPCNHVVVIPKAGTSPGQPVQTVIESCRGMTLRGRPVHSKASVVL